MDLFSRLPLERKEQLYCIIAWQEDLLSPFSSLFTSSLFSLFNLQLAVFAYFAYNSQHRLHLTIYAVLRKCLKTKAPSPVNRKKKKKKTDMLPREEQQQHRPKSGKSVTMTYHYNNTFSPLLRNQMKLTECFLQPAVFA